MFLLLGLALRRLTTLPRQGVVPFSRPYPLSIEAIWAR